MKSGNLLDAAVVSARDTGLGNMLGWARELDRARMWGSRTADMSPGVWSGF